MKTPRRKSELWIAMIVLLSAGWLGSARASVGAVPQTEQEVVDEMKLITQIEQLQKQLESQDVDRRAAAEDELFKLGPVVLDHLETTETASTETLQRIARVRSKLEKLAMEKFTQASLVTLEGKFDLEQALSLISDQTGNKISADDLPVPILEKELQLNLVQVEFWNALYDVMHQAGVMIDSYGGETGTIKIIPANGRVGAGNPAIAEADQAGQTPRCLAGMFDFAVSRVVSERAFNKSGPARQGSTQLTLTARWEPRLQPISIEMPFEFITVLDENGEELKLLREEGVFYAAASAEYPEVELTIPLELIDRKIKRIKKIEAVLVALLPGRQETFRFKSIAQLKEGAELSKGGARLTFEDVIKNDDLYGVTLKLSFDESFNALESHRAWAYDNPMYLEDAKGNKLEPVTMEGLRQSNQEVAIRYYFTEDPKDCRIVYKTVAAIVKQDIRIKLENIDLP